MGALPMGARRHASNATRAPGKPAAHAGNEQKKQRAWTAPRDEKAARPSLHFVCKNRKGRLIRQHLGFSLKGVTAPMATKKATKKTAKKTTKKAAKKTGKKTTKKK